MNVSMNPTANATMKLQTSDASGKLENSGDALANEMKDIHKARLRRQVMADPSLAGKLVATEASPMYNARGEVIQAISTNLGAV